MCSLMDCIQYVGTTWEESTDRLVICWLYYSFRYCRLLLLVMNKWTDANNMSVFTLKLISEKWNAGYNFLLIEVFLNTKF